jgi:hypothetical protein
MGLPPDSKLTRVDLAQRVNDCTGVNLAAEKRTPAQQQALDTLTRQARIPERSLIGHLNWGTFTLRDVVSRTKTSPFGNEGVRYTGSDDDVALNAGVKRYPVDPAAAARFAADVDYVGRFGIPVLAAHGINDSTVFVEGTDTLRRRMEATGNGARLVQTFINSNQHSYWGDAMYPPLFEALLNWVEKGVKPNPASIAARCQAMRAAKPADCLFNVDYVAKPLASRIPPR